MTASFSRPLLLTVAGVVFRQMRCRLKYSKYAIATVQRGELPATVLAVDLVLDAYSCEQRSGVRIFRLLLFTGASPTLLRGACF